MRVGAWWLLLAAAGLGSCDGGKGGGTVGGAPPDTALPGETGGEETAGPGDADGDGWTADQDCDDGDPAVHPGAQEVCNGGTDDDCDGEVDEAGAEGCAPYYRDDDGDGVGVEEDVACLCGPEAPHTASEAGDCDDGDASVHPGAEEVCDNLVDDDCDGTSGDCAPAGGALADADLRLLGAQDRGAAGALARGRGDFDGDGLADVVVGAPGEDSDAGALYLVAGNASVDALDLSEPLARWTGAEGSFAGYASAWVGDLDGDGLDDLLVGAPEAADPGGARPGGAVLLLSGSAPAGGALEDAGALLLGAADDDGLGAAVAGAGDVDGDGVPDLLVGAPENDDNGAGAGAAWIVPGGAAASGGRVSDLGVELLGEDEGHEAGWSLDGAGDVDGDGFADVLVGAPGAAGASAGATYLVLGSAAPSQVDLSEADARWTGEAAGDHAGWAVAAAGDVDGDGHADLLVGAPGSDRGAADGGAVHLVLGDAAPAGGSLADAAATWWETHDAALAGWAVAGVGDVDGDGFDDVLAGVPGYASAGTTVGGAVLVLGGSAPASATLDAAGARWTGEGDGEGAGSWVAGPGDVDGSGHPDLLVGAPQHDTPTRTWAGATYLLLGHGL